jgi:NAD-dependent dihydropyrimidine dehydrogenase PreA subunit
MPVVVIEESCDACESCVSVCPTDSITVEEVAVVENEECIDCGACIDECPNEALELE